MSNILTLKEALTILESGEACAVEFIKFDKQKRKHHQNGARVRYGDIRILWRDKEAQTVVKANKSARKSAKPNHSLHFTRNFVVYAGGIKTAKIIKIHPVLIIRLNGKRVLL